jgi:hypothetical protein
MKKLLYASILLFAVIIASCSKKTDVLSFENIQDYNLQIIGKQITYRLDSTLYIHFGTKDTVISYFVKDSVMAQVTDNLGRTAYRIFRYSRQGTTAPWIASNTFMTVPQENTIEFIENNNRFLKLKQPVREGYSWKGNTYLDTYSLLSDIKYMDDWDYTYEDVDQPLVLGAFTLDSTITVNQRDEEIGDFANDTTYSEKNLSIEKYAKGIGLVSRNFLHWEYQPYRPIPAVPPRGYKIGYGVTMTMIGHN